MDFLETYRKPSNDSAFETKFIPEIARKWPSETTATRKKKTIPGLTFPTDYALREWNDRPTYSSYEMDREMVSISFNLSLDLLRNPSNVPKKGNLLQRLYLNYSIHYGQGKGSERNEVKKAKIYQKTKNSYKQSL